MFLHNCRCQQHRRQIMSRQRSWRSGWKVVIDDTCCPWCIDHWLLVQASADFMNKSHDHHNGNPSMPWEFRLFSAILRIILTEGLLLTSTLMHRLMVAFLTLCRLQESKVIITIAIVLCHASRTLKRHLLFNPHQGSSLDFYIDAQATCCHCGTTCYPEENI